MLLFDPTDPYPLLDPNSHTYVESKEHATQVDAWLGLEINRVENDLASRKPEFRQSSAPSFYEQLWVGIPHQGILTPYTEARLILSQLNPKPGETLVDLGAAYGRFGFVLARHYPEVNFIGYEFLPERVNEAARCLKAHGCGKSEMIQVDLSAPDFRPPEVEYYFIYDFGAPKSIGKVLDDLRDIAVKRPIVVVGRGSLCRHKIKKSHPWLCEIVPPQKFDHYTIYRSGEELLEL